MMTRYRLCLIAGWILLAATGPAMAHGKVDHTTKSTMDKHMQAMMAAKEQVPEDYRIMERTPIIPDAESLARGAELYSKNCAVCHGDKGDGKGPAASALPTPPANFLDAHHSGMYNPGEKFWIIDNGSKGTGMPPFPGLSPADRWHLINHILSLQQSQSLEDLFTPEKAHHH